MVRQERRVRLPRPVGEIWPLAADTERLNREMGLPSISYAFEPHPLGGTLKRGSVAVAGVVLTYLEEPFEWEREKYFQVRRIFDSGPLVSAVGGTRFFPDGDATELEIWAEAETRGPASGVLARAFVADSLRKAERVCLQLLSTPGVPFPRQASGSPGSRREATLAVQRASEMGVSRRELEKLAEFILTASPADLAAIRPYAAASQLGIPRDEAAAVMLAAVRGGLTNLRWRVLCPNCRGARTTHGSLQDVEVKRHCESCGITFDADFDKNVELVFRPTVPVRPIDLEEYCIAGPMTSPHVAAQINLQPGEVRRLDQPPGPSLRVRSPQAAAPVAFTGPCRAVLTPDGLTAEPADMGLELENRTAHLASLLVEESGWRQDILTAHEASLLPGWRKWFGSEVLREGEEHSVERVAILFTDLCGSTSLYRERGDAPSYALVRDHFTVAFDIVEAHGGSVVKTIGDSIMAAFASGPAALEAAVQIRDATHASGLGLKGGVAEGPALVVSGLSGLDYFGETVNLAAKLQKAAPPGAILVHERVAASLRDRQGEPIATELAPAVRF